MKGFMMFSKKGKLSLRYIGPYWICKRVGNVAYELELPKSYKRFIWHCMCLCWRNVGIKDSLTYEKVLQILDHQVCKLKTKKVASVKVLWRNQFVEETTWEVEDIKRTYPHLFEFGENSYQGTKFSPKHFIRLCVSMLLLVFICWVL